MSDVTTIANAANSLAMAPPSAENALIPMTRNVLQPEQFMNLAALDDAQRKEVNRRADAVSFENSNTLLLFGAQSQTQLNDHLDQLLEGLRTGDAGRAGEITIELATTVKQLRLKEIKEEIASKGSLMERLSHLPVVGSWVSALQYLRLNHKKISEHLEAIEKKAREQMARLQVNNDKLDAVVDATLTHIKNVELDMAAGQIVVVKGRAQFESRRQAVLVSKDMVEIAKLRDFAEQLHAFETRLVRLHIAHGNSIVNVPSVRATQRATLIEMNNLMDSLLVDLPQLKRAIIQVAALAETSKASQDTDRRRELTRELQGIVDDQVQDTYLHAKASQGDFDTDVALLAQSANKLLETIAKGDQIDQENAAKRQAAIESLNKTKAEFKQGLLTTAENFTKLHANSASEA